jgi:hypothetical protein
MSKLKQWILNRIKYPEKMTAFDHKLIDFIGDVLPSWIGVVINFAILSFIYFWIYNKYGLDRTLILLLISMLLSIGRLTKAIGG